MSRRGGLASYPSNSELPEPPLDDMTLWLAPSLDQYLLNEATDPDQVLTWYGKAPGLLWEFFQLVASDQPTYGLAGLPFSSFDGVSELLNTSFSPISLIVGAGAYLYGGVARQDGVPSLDFPLATSYLNSGLINDAGGYWGVFVRSTGPSLIAYHWDTAARGVEAVIPMNEWFTWMVRYNGVVVELWINGVSQGTSAAAALGSVASGPRMGTRPSLGAYWDGSQAALLVYDSIGDVLGLQTYLDAVKARLS